MKDVSSSFATEQKNILEISGGRTLTTSSGVSRCRPWKDAQDGNRKGPRRGMQFWHSSKFWAEIPSPKARKTNQGERPRERERESGRVGESTTTARVAHRSLVARFTARVVPSAGKGDGFRCPALACVWPERKGLVVVHLAEASKVEARKVVRHGSHWEPRALCA